MMSSLSTLGCCIIIAAAGTVKSCGKAAELTEQIAKSADDVPIDKSTASRRTASIATDAAKAANQASSSPPTRITSGNKISTIAIAPTSKQQFENVFHGRTMSAGDQRQLEQFRQSVSRNMSDVHFVDDLSSITTLLDDWFKNAQSNTVIITGHSMVHNGERCLVLPTGEFLSKRLIGQHAMKYNKDFLIITCFEDSIELHDEIKFSETAALLELLSKSEIEDSSRILREFCISEIQNLRSKKQFIIIAGATSGTGILGMIATYAYTPINEEIEQIGRNEYIWDNMRLRQNSQD